MVAVRRNVAALVLAGLLLLLTVPNVQAEGVTVQVFQHPTLSTILTDSSGRTLYRFTKDTPNISSACYGQCATVWPPLLVASGNPVAGTGVDGNLLGVLVRTDGARQVMFNGMPLYYFNQDVTAGDIHGQRLRDVWFIVHPNTSTVGNQGVTLHVRQHASLGPILTDLQGRTLYWFTKDKGMLSVCYDRCASIWPPLLVGAVDPQFATGIGGKLSTSLRDDGGRQVGYEGKLLYYYAPDTTIGDTRGQGVGNVWFVVPPIAASASPSATPPPTATAVSAPAAPTAPPTPPSSPAKRPSTLPNTGLDDQWVGAIAVLALLMISCGSLLAAARRRNA